VTLSWTGQQLPTYSIEAPDIADLSLGPSKTQSTYANLENQHPRESSVTPTQQSFVDPAIVSYGKPPSKSFSPPVLQSQSFPNVLSAQQFQASQQAHYGDATVSAALTEPFSNLELNIDNNAKAPKVAPQTEEPHDAPDENEGLAPLQAASQFTTKRSRRSGRTGHPQNVAGNEHDGANNTNPKTKGWRQTAFVQPADTSEFRTPQKYKESFPDSTGRRRKKRGRGYAEDPNGWATEDATDIQEMGDFDFESNLSKFDKRRVFEEIRNDDTTADEDRLVSFNRRPRPGTNGGKNLHWTENVLDSPQESENGDSDQGRSDAKLSSGNYSGREPSRASARARDSRKGSAILGQPLVPPQINSIGRSQLTSSRTTSPRPNKTPVSASPMAGAAGSGASLRLTTTNRSCPTVSPLQTLEVEQIAVAELGLTEDMITENAGRDIAEAAVGLLSNDAAAPTILVLTGNHRTGARAVSAARHLRNRGHRVTLCVLGLEHENELLESCRKQLDVFKKIGGRVFRWEDLSAQLSSSDFTPDLVVDALFGIHISFEDLRTDDQAIAFEMIAWVNRSNLDILSVDVPSGLSASSGEVTMVEDGRVCVNSTSVVCLGAPKTGVVNALLAGEGLSWKLSVADIGIPQIVWRKYGTRRRHGIDFGNRWVVPLRFQPPPA
jgi:enhancer of mRNA-decapping protein 3